jgi:hypothetical protein
VPVATSKQVSILCSYHVSYMCRTWLTVDSTDSRTGGDLLVQCLLAHGVPLWTCVPGESFLPVLDALHGAGDRIRLVTASCRAVTGFGL